MTYIRGPEVGGAGLVTACEGGRGGAERLCLHDAAIGEIDAALAEQPDGAREGGGEGACVHRARNGGERVYIGNSAAGGEGIARDGASAGEEGLKLVVGNGIDEDVDEEAIRECREGLIGGKRVGGTRRRRAAGIGGGCGRGGRCVR
jgi:hypothetical protein